MMQTASLFRLFIVLSVVLSIVGAVIDGLFPGLVPEDLRRAQEAAVNEDFRVQDFLVLLLRVPLIIVGIVNIIALYKFRPWAPGVALYITIAATALYPLLDAQVVSPWSLLLSETSFLLWGAVLAMAFLSPVSERFRELPANSSMQPTGMKPPAAD